MKLTKFFPLVICAVVATGCNQKDLCLNHWEHEGRCDVEIILDWDLAWQVPYNAQTDWSASWGDHDFGIPYESLNPSKPSGIHAVIYSDPKDRYDSRNLPANGGLLPMSEGRHSILMYNNDTRYIVFRDLNNLASATASTRSRSRNSYLGTLKTTDTENTVSCPDALFGHYIEDFEVSKTQQMPIVDVMMKPLTYTYLVRYKFDSGVKHVALARGALAGMAASVYLTDGHTGNDICTFLYDADVKDWGVEAKVTTFGIPNFPNDYYSRSGDAYGLNLEVRLKNGKIFNFNFDVTEQIRYQPHGGVIEVGGVVITDEMAKEESGSFDVTVEGWGPHKDIDLVFTPAN